MTTSRRMSDGEFWFWVIMLVIASAVLGFCLCMAV